jgi:hypothetical protein
MTMLIELIRPVVHLTPTPLPSPSPVVDAGAGGVSILFVLTLIGILAYFMPFLVGIRKRDAAAIFVLNLFLGWTFCGMGNCPGMGV